MVDVMNAINAVSHYITGSLAIYGIIVLHKLLATTTTTMSQTIIDEHLVSNAGFVDWKRCKLSHQLTEHRERGHDILAAVEVGKLGGRGEHLVQGE